MNFEFMTIDTPLPPCMPFPRALTGFPVSSTAKVMYCRMLDAMLFRGQADENGILFVCLRPDGSLELPSTLGTICRKIAQKLDGFEGFHFHQLRHTYTSNLLANGAAPKDVQELLGHSDVSTTMNVYAHSTRKAKRESAKLLDKVVGND